MLVILVCVPLLNFCLVDILEVVNRERGRSLYLSMPAKDVFHDNVKNALEKDGWLVTAIAIFYSLRWRRNLC